MFNFKINPLLISAFKVKTWMLVIYNYVIVLLIANQEVIWKYSFKNADLIQTLDHTELFEPKILTKFGICFRLLTTIMNTLAIATLIDTKRQKRYFLLPCICWNFFTITAITENMIEIIFTLIELEVKFIKLAIIIITTISTVAFQSKLTLQVIRFYEYLNYMTN